jgi:DNA-binding transcriptional LysR family regulator
VRFEQLEYLAAVTRHGSLRRASEELHLSQPALSEALRNLERELGVTLLDRRRTGARINPQGRELLPAMAEVLEAVDRLRVAAGDQAVASRMLRIGTVNAGTSALVVPTVRDFRQAHPSTPLELVNVRHAEVQQGLVEGALDVGLVNVLPGDDVPPELHATVLLQGRPVVCLTPDHPLAAKDRVSLEELRQEPLIAMRAGYLMHRLVHRLFDGRLPAVTLSTDGAEMAKVLVAEGVGVTILPDYSVAGDPLVTAGAVVHRRLQEDATAVTLLCLRHAGRPTAGVRALEQLLVQHARRWHSPGS